MVDDDHRAVVEVGDALPGFLSLTHDLYTHRLAGQDDRLQRVGQLVDVEHGYAAELGHLVEVVIVRQHLGAQRLAELDEFAVDLAHVRKVGIGDLDLDLTAPLQPLQHVESALAPVASQRIRGVGDLLQLAQHELRHDQRPIDEAGLADVGDASIDDHRCVEHLRELPPPSAREEDGRHRLEIGPPAQCRGSAEIGAEQRRQPDAGHAGVGHERRDGGTDGKAGDDPEESADGAPEESLDRHADGTGFQPDRDTAEDGTANRPGRDGHLEGGRQLDACPR